MTTKQASATDVRQLPDHILALQIVRCELLIDQGHKGMSRRREELMAERKRRLKELMAERKRRRKS